MANIFHPAVSESTEELLLVGKVIKKRGEIPEKAKFSNTDLISHRKWLYESKEICYILIV